MLNLIKALVPGAFLSWIISTFVGTRGSTGGLLHIEHFAFQGYQIYGSWTLLLIATGLSWAILMMMD